MIISVNPKPELAAFQDLMRKTDSLLNSDAQRRPQYYLTRNGTPLEDDVKEALEEAAKGTPFEKTIEKVSGQKFPDIVASRCYGVEVKSTKEDHWTSTGSSIMESSRVADVERIYMTFGKLGGTPIQFLSRPYEHCLSGIAVTHMPRYLIDMRLKAGETIFDKLGIPYDELRVMENPVAPVSKYYRSRLKPGETLWWTGESADEAVSAKIRLWSTLSAGEKKEFKVYALVNYPEIFGGSYENYALWLASQGVVDTHTRDQFSAGGRVDLMTSGGVIVRMPAIYGRVRDHIDDILHALAAIDAPELVSKGLPVPADKFTQRTLAWCKTVSLSSTVDFDLSMDVLQTMIFQ